MTVERVASNMTPAWVPVLSMLLVSVNAAQHGAESSPCTEIQTSGTTVVLGSRVTASCVVRANHRCQVYREVTYVEWHLGPRLLSRSKLAANGSQLAANGSKLAATGNARVSTVVIANVSDSRAYLTCCVQMSVCQLVGGVEIKAGYPPLAPHNISCQTNLTTPSTITCYWDPMLSDTHLPTQYTLYTHTRKRNTSHSYVLPAGVHRLVIRRSEFGLYNEMEVCVMAANELGQASSEPIRMKPINVAKLDPPRVVMVQPGSLGCLLFRWSLSTQQTWVSNNNMRLMGLEARHRPSQSSPWTQLPCPSRKSRMVEVCDLLHGTQYQVQIRARYNQSPWSAWSRAQSGVTPARAPAGCLDYWMKISKQGKEKQMLTVRLFWKPSKQFQANGKILCYLVSLQRPPDEGLGPCSTAAQNYTLRLPRGARTLFLFAANSAGWSGPTVVNVLPPKALLVVSNVTVQPRGDRSLLVQWRGGHSGSGGSGNNGTLVTGYVVEWRLLFKTNASLLHFDLADRNQSSMLITGHFEPYKPYEVSVYPRFNDGIGLPKTVIAYSRQKAPSTVPKLKFKSTWHSYVELMWDEIPLEQRNGIIESYKIFYWESPDQMKVVSCDGMKRRVLLMDLNMALSYKAFLMISTGGGSLTGSTIIFQPRQMDAVVVVTAVVLFSVGVLLVPIFTLIICLKYQNWMKVWLCPMVPDPANSSVKRWSSDSLQQDGSLAWDVGEPSVVYLSHLSLTELPGKMDTQSITEDTSDLGESICGSPLTPMFPETHSESVSYATVICTGPYKGRPANPSRAYLRSESTQPLLDPEEPAEAKDYQNMATDDDVIAQKQFFFGQTDEEEKADSTNVWEDFPMLRALALSHAPSDI